MTGITCTLQEDRCALMIVSRGIFLQMKNVPDRSCRKNKNTFNVRYIFSPENRAVCEIMWKNVVERGWPQMTIWRMRSAYWIPKSINTHSEYVILIAFPLQQWLHAHASVLRHTYIACLFENGVQSF
jgi:hypothetical protein